MKPEFTKTASTSNFVWNECRKASNDLRLRDYCNKNSAVMGDKSVSRKDRGDEAVFPYIIPLISVRSNIVTTW